MSEFYFWPTANGEYRMANIDDYPQLRTLLAPKSTVSNVETKEIGGMKYVRVTEHFDDQEGGQSLFKITGKMRRK